MYQIGQQIEVVGYGPSMPAGKAYIQGISPNGKRLTVMLIASGGLREIDNHEIIR